MNKTVDKILVIKNKDIQFKNLAAEPKSSRSSNDERDNDFIYDNEFRERINPVKKGRHSSVVKKLNTAQY